MKKNGLRFAMVTTFYPPYHFGGDGQAIRRLVHALARRGHEVDVIHDVDAFRMLGDREEREPLEEPPGVRVHGLRSRAGSLSCLLTQQLGRPVVHGRRIEDILDNKFDVIHYHNISLVGGPGVLACGTGIKLYTAHEHWLVCPSHVLWRHNREVCTGRECLRCVLNYRRPPQLWRAGSMLQRQSRHVDAFLTFSRFCAEKHEEYGFDRPLTVVPQFLPESEGENGTPAETDDGAEDPPYFLFVGRLEIIKGLQDVIPLFGDDAPAEIRIAGSGNYEPVLRELAAGSSKVRFLGTQNAQQLQRLYRDAIAVVMPSICYEVFPMVVLEAFREGTPVIARALGPFPEIIERSRGGLLFETTEELRDAIRSLSRDRSLRSELGQAGAEAFKTHWSETVAMESYFALIQRIAKDRGLDQVVNRISGHSSYQDQPVTAA